MNLILRRIALYATALVVYSGTMASSHTYRMTTDISPKEISELMEKGDVPGLSLAVIHDGKIAWTTPLGEKNAIKDGKTDTPVTKDTLFPAASLSKPVFAYAALRLVDRGMLDLDKPLFQYLPYPRLEHDERYKRITARMVLSHSTGLPNWGGTPLTMLHAPGERFGYSGEGFVYLQKAVEKLTALSLETLAKQEVFGPLHMTHSTYEWSPALAEKVVSGYNGNENPQIVNNATAVSAYSLLTTADDYARFVLAIIKGTGLKKETAKNLLTTQIEAPRPEAPKGVSWGLGWGLEESDSGKYFWHWGDNGGFKCFVIASRAKRQGMVYFTNTQEGLSIVSALVSRVLGGTHPVLKWIGYDQYDSPKSVASKELRQVYVHQGEEVGLARYRELHQKAPEVIDEKFTNDFGYFLRGHGKQEAAIALWKENLRNYPKFADTYDTLCWTYFFMNKIELALENMEKAFALEPTATQRKDQIAWMRDYLRVQKEPIPVSEETLQTYIGNYKERQITLVKGNLVCTDAKSKESHRLIPLSETTFILEGDAWTRLRFLADKGMKAHGIAALNMEGRQEEIARDP